MANFANISFLAKMYLFMYFQLSSLCKTFPTFVATEWLLTCMSTHMDSENIALVKSVQKNKSLYISYNMIKDILNYRLPQVLHM